MVRGLFVAQRLVRGGGVRKDREGFERGRERLLDVGRDLKPAGDTGLPERGRGDLRLGERRFGDLRGGYLK